MAWFTPRAFAFTRTNEKLYAPIAKIPITIRKVVYFGFRTFPAFLNMLVVFLRPPLWTTKYTGTTTAIEPGTSEMRNGFLIAIMGMRKKARMGPIMAPSWSSDRWRPKARPLTASLTESLIRASRGEVRIPFPARSVSLTARASAKLLVTEKKGLATVERA